MTKIMLVEDDKSLREIYGVRLLAEGYDIVSAGDGEEALAVAIKERPALIISDVMMPKISGFDMLDILRSTTETRNVKVIMMTALSSDEQRARGEQLGADRYLVKSQVGIEDVVRVVHEVLGDAPGAFQPANSSTPQTSPTASSAAFQSRPAPQTTTPQQPPQVTQQNTTFSRPVQPSVAPRVPQPPSTNPRPAAPVVPSQQVQGGLSHQLQQPQSSSQVGSTQPAQQMTPSSQPQQTNGSTDSNNRQTPSGRAKVIEPINNPHEPQVDINELFNKEMAKQSDGQSPAVPTADQERDLMDSQLNAYAQQPAPRAAAPSSVAEPAFIETPTPQTQTAPQTSTTSQQDYPQNGPQAGTNSIETSSQNRPAPASAPSQPPVAL